MIRTREGLEFQGSDLREAWPVLLELAHGDGNGDIPHADECPLWNLYAPVAAGHGDLPFVMGQLGQSLDGRIATATGKSRYISGPEVIRHLHRLRALVDAVVVGVGTVIADNPQLNVREAEGPCPARVVIDPNFRLPSGACMLGDGAQPIYAVQAEEHARPPGVETVMVARKNGALRPGDIVRALAERGFRRILVEGGATTLSAFLSAGALHRLHLSIAPVLIGSGPVGVNLPPIDELEDAMRPATIMYQLGDDMMFDCAFAVTPGLGVA